MEQTLPQSFDPSSLRESVFVACVAGNSSLSSIMHVIEQSGADIEKFVSRLLHDMAFLREVEKARERIDETVIGWFKKRGMKYAQRMDTLTDNQDPRVAFQATKDLLDRIGTKPEMRVAVSGMDQYKALLKELTPDELPQAQLEQVAGVEEPKDA